METVFRIRTADLNIGFLETIKSLFGREGEVEIAVHPAGAKSVLKETRAAYFARLEKAKENAEKGNVISFTPRELAAFAKKVKGK